MVTHIAALAAICCSLSLEPAGSAHLDPPGKSAGQAPNFLLKAPDGRSHQLQHYRGKVVLVNFWASWCPPCIAEMPGMQRLADRMADRPFALLAVNVGESAFRVAKFLALIGVDFTTLLDESGETFRTWGGKALPTSYVLDGVGRVRYVAYGKVDWDDEDIVAALSALAAEAAADP